MRYKMRQENQFLHLSIKKNAKMKA